MSESNRAAQEAGALLREARLKQNLHIAALAASIKVTPAKLEALEAGRFDQLPDATFARALAQSVCRVLKIDAQPVLALLPSGAAVALEKVDAGLNTPFRERQGRVAPAEWLMPRQPLVWGVVLLLLGAAAAFVLMPSHLAGQWLPPAATQPSVVVRTEPLPAPASAAQPPEINAVAAATPTAEPSAAPLDAPAASVPVPSAGTASLPAPFAGTASVSPAVPAAPSPAPAPGAQLTARDPSWVQVTDANGVVLLSRTLKAGEVVDLEGPRPLRLRIGNVQGTELVDKGQKLDLASRTRDNVLNLELP